MKKNLAGQRIGCQLVSATDGSAFTGSVTVSVTVDAGTQATGTVGSGACTHEGNGYHTYAPSQAETNGDLVAYTFTGSGAVPATVQVYTLPTTGILAPTVADRTLDVSAGGEAGLDWGNIGSPTTTVALSGTTAGTVTTLTNLPAVTAGWLTATGIAADAITAAKVAADVGTEIATATLTALGTGTWATAIPWNAAWDAEVQSECADALTAYGVSTFASGGSVNVTQWNGSAATSSETNRPLVAVGFWSDWGGSQALGDVDVSFSADGLWVRASDGTAVATAAALATVAGYIDTEVAAIKAKTDLIPAAPAAVGSAMTLATDAVSAAAVSAAGAAKIADVSRRRTQANVESSSDGDTLSVGSLYGLIQMAQESAVSGTTLTVKRTDGSTTLGTKTVATDAAADPVVGVS